jgi:hypothetical protein
LYATYSRIMPAKEVGATRTRATGPLPERLRRVIEQLYESSPNSRLRVVTHLYTLLLGGTVIPGGGQPDVSAVAWAGDIVIALGSDEDVRAISRGDSHFVDLRGAFVVPLGEGTLEVGGPADLAVLSGDPRIAGARSPADPAVQTLAVVRGGRVVSGALPRASPQYAGAG